MANGSGMSGVAGKVTTFLKGKGIETLPATDATTKNYAETIVYYLDGFQQQAASGRRSSSAASKVGGVVPDTRRRWRAWVTPTCWWSWARSPCPASTPSDVRAAAAPTDVAVGMVALMTVLADRRRASSCCGWIVGTISFALNTACSLLAVLIGAGYLYLRYKSSR